VLRRPSELAAFIRHWTSRRIKFSISRVRVAKYVRACAQGELVGVLVLCTLLPAHAADIQPNQYLPSIQDRERYSDIVCSATIVNAYTTGNVKQLEGEERSEWIAEARVDRIFKGFLGSQLISFRYYRLGPRTGSYFGPPVADFHSGIRYVVFLRGRDANLSVAVPFYQMEIEVAPRQVPLDESKTAPELALARELLFAIESAPQTIGRLADHYFSWVEELVGKRSVPLVRPFLDSSDALVRYDAAWWLSFRQIDATVTNELKRAAQDESLEESQRSSARDRLRDMAEGKWVP
jgi:hypothetical protein